MKIDLTLQELELIGEILDEHLECLGEYYDVAAYPQYEDEQKLAEKIWNFYQEEKK